VGVRAVLAKVTLLFLLEVLANLGLVVVVRDVEHLILNFNGKLLKKSKGHEYGLKIIFQFTGNW